MPWCRLEDTFYDDLKWDQIAEASGASRVTIAGHAALLYSWCVRHAPDGVIGDQPQSAIMRVMHVFDDKIFQNFVETKILVKTEDGYEVNGYAERSESYNASKRKAKSRKRRNKNVTSLSRDIDATVTSLSHASHVEKRERREKKEREEIVVQKYRSALKEKRGIETATTMTKKSIQIARKILTLWPNDWESVIEFFLHQTSPGLEKYNWPLGWLVEYSDDFDTRWRNRDRTATAVAEPRVTYDPSEKVRRMREEFAAAESTKKKTGES